MLAKLFNPSLSKRIDIRILSMLLYTLMATIGFGIIAELARERNESSHENKEN